MRDDSGYQVLAMARLYKKSAHDSYDLNEYIIYLA